ncbi:uncharacterized protein LOC143175120 [Nomia melanderi]|uniref:uncharacterized protein LOC143175120 n=1 Tax=Nomia melanderi TaxID=2448451 RepID=UPI003FCD220F
MPRKPKYRRRAGKPEDTRDSKRQALIIREAKITGETTERCQSSWRGTFMRMEMPDIEKTIEIAWKNLQYALDLREHRFVSSGTLVNIYTTWYIGFRIGLLLDVLQEAEDHRRSTNGARAEVIDRSLQVHGARLKAADAFFYRRIGTLFADRIQEFHDIHHSRNKDESNIRRINILVNHRIENELYTGKSNTIS